MKRNFLLLCLLIISAFQVFGQKKEARLLRFPAVHGDRLVFSYAGDLYSSSSKGGVAKKLTTGEGYEMFARFSPDGTQIAFTAQYDGNTEVYRMPVDGGEPVRLTYTATLGRDDLSDRMGPNNIVMTWKDNKTIVYRSRMKSFNDFKGSLFLASVDGGISEELPLPTGGFCSYSPDKTKLAYNRVFREFRTWKYYKGGMADDIRIYDFNTKQTENITNNIYQDICPMWTGDNIYYISDRDRIMNLFAYNVKTKETKKVTNFDKYDIKFPSLGDNAIVFENGGYIYSFDLKTQKYEKLTIFIEEDFSGRRPVLKDVSRSARNIDLSTDGKRIVLSARGDIFTVPVTSGVTRNLSETSGVHERDSQWSPDGKWIAYISDETGEDEIFIRNQDGLQTPVQLTKNSDTYKYRLLWSPDSKKILWSDKLQRLRYIDIDSKKITEVEQTIDGEIRDFSWSPDNNWITYTFPRFNTTSVIVVYNLDSGKKEEVTDDWFDSWSPSFSDDGKYLTFVSARDFSPTYSGVEWNYAYSGMSKIYIVPLSKKTPSPFAYTNDEVTVKEEKTPDEPKKPDESKKTDSKKTDDKKDSKSSDIKVEIDFDGIKGRSLALDIPSGNYSSPIFVGNSIYYSRYGSGHGLHLFDLKSKKESELGNFGIAAVTADRKKFLVSSMSGYTVIDAPKGKINVEKTINLSEVKVFVNLREEWNQIYNECWRQMRDFFYDPELHGVDWKAIREKYLPLVEYVNDRNDLNYIIGEMIGELTTGHCYISGGDKYAPPRVKTGLLGAKISRDKSGYYRIDRILEGRNWSSALRSPLTEIGVDASEGDFIIAINGKSTNKINDVYAALYDKADKQIELTLNKTASETGSRKVLVKPVDDESSLYYFDWVQRNIEKVNKATNGEVGYIHIPDMGATGLNEFVKYYYPQLNKKALIIDDRGNGGGNVSPMIIERLRRELSLLSAPRNGRPEMKPGGTMAGPKILLVDLYSASDGDLFPYQFKYHQLGKLVGTRTWGGVVGIRGTLPIVDGGSLNRPEFAHLDAEGKQFIIEGHGVEPDVVVDNDPAKEYAGEDQQLDKAIELILQELKTKPVNIPDKFPAYPNKSKDIKNVNKTLNTKGTEYIEQIDSVKIRITLSTLASDAFEGRGTGKQGGEIAQEYIVAYLDSCGIKTGNNNSYYQSLNHIKSLNDAKRLFTVNGIDYPDDYKYENLYCQDSILNITEIVFIAAGTDIDSVKLDEINDKTVMKLNDTLPDYIDSQNPKTVINIIPDFKPASATISEKFYFTPPDSKFQYNKISVSPNLADKLLKSTGKTLKEITGEVEKNGKTQIFTLKTNAEIYGNTIYQKTKVSNILGIIEGSDLKNEYIILSAHHDHVGIINQKIHNGADDNASGVSSVLEIARLMAKAKKDGKGPRRSVVILLPAAEELGLIGSNYYVNNPVFPLTETKACINVDMVGRIDSKYKSTNGDYIYIVNDEKTNGNLLETVEKSNNDNIVINTIDLNSLFSRSDHYNFAKHNIPAVLLTSGLHNDYHTPRDDAELIDFGAVWKRCRLILALIWNLAND